MIRNRSLVVAVWVLLALFGFYANANINSLLTTSISVPDSQSAKADEVIKSAFGETTEGAFSVFYQYNKKLPKSEVAALQEKINQAVATLSELKIAQNRALNGVIYANIQSSLNLQKAAELTPKLRQALKAAGLSGIKVSGPPAIKYDVSPVLASDLQRGQLIAIFIALIFLFITLQIGRAHV